MSTPLVSLEKGLNMAFSRLKVWFDPAQTGSPYETSHLSKNGKKGRQYGVFAKRLSMRI